jgi:NADH:ubiquinone oxidoreductase subunit 5 (subunit L)/multisubunit Na+/H+ antiporter MnhA subunit
MLALAPQRFKALKHVAFRGMWQKHPVRSTLIFLAGAALVGVPPSPMFFFEDLFLNTAIDTSISIAILVGLTQAVNGLSVFKAAAEMTMGRLPDFADEGEAAQSFNLLYDVGNVSNAASSSASDN